MSRVVSPESVPIHLHIEFSLFRKHFIQNTSDGSVQNLNHLHNKLLPDNVETLLFLPAIIQVY